MLNDEQPTFLNILCHRRFKVGTLIIVVAIMNPFPEDGHIKGIVLSLATDLIPYVHNVLSSSIYGFPVHVIR